MNEYGGGVGLVSALPACLIPVVCTSMGVVWVWCQLSQPV